MKNGIDKRVDSANKMCMFKYNLDVKEISILIGVSLRQAIAWFVSGAGDSVDVCRGQNRRIIQINTSIRSRCKNKASYIRKDIRVMITKAEILLLWYIHKADKMSAPAFERIDAYKDYNFKNCRFMDKKPGSVEVNNIDKLG